MDTPPEQAWIFGTLAVTVARVDFLDPNHATTPDPRERGVRVELRPTRSDHQGSIYASPQIGLAPAVCRFDLLESAPQAADRMHWHPDMNGGEPGRRFFDPEIPADPLRWLADRLHEVETLLERSGADEIPRHRASVARIAEACDEIVEAVRDGLAWARQPWPDVRHDERGMALPA